MSCYHPLIGLWKGEYTDNGKKKFKIEGNLDPALAKVLYPGSTIIPCGKCIGCRLDYSRSWADRMMLELDTCKKAVFVTLTYDCRNLVDKDGKSLYICPYPDIDSSDCPMKYICGSRCRMHGSLYKPHLQSFMKNLRADLDYNYNGLKVRFFACGEYGDVKNTHRPHYHIILFGIGLDDLHNKVRVGFNELRQEVYTDSLIQRHWPFGFVSVGDVSWRSCAYVSRYVTKKALDPGNDALIESLDKNPLFSVMSRKPGIGKPYLDLHPDCLDMMSLVLSTKDGVKKVNIPKFFIKQLNNPVTDEYGVISDLYNPDRYDRIIAERTVYAENSMLRKLYDTDLNWLDYLKVEEQNKLSAIRSLKRKL